MPGNKKNRRKEIQKTRRITKSRELSRSTRQVISVKPPTGRLAVAALAAFAIATKKRR